MNEEKGLNAIDRLRAEAALDGELDASHALAFERDLAANPALRALYDRHAWVRTAVRESAARELAPLSLRRRVDDIVRPRSTVFSPRVLAIAASLVLAFAVGALSGAFWPSMSEADPRLAALVASYMRGAISGQPYDIASSDRHTVKPWLAARAPLGAEAVDLAPQGFPLVGGRVDIVEKRAVPTLIYRRREHIIAVTELPLEVNGAPGKMAVDGFHVERWRDAERAYVAISDIDASELDSFMRDFRAASGRQP